MDQHSLNVPISIKIASGLWVTYGGLIGIGALMMLFMVDSASDGNTNVILVTALLLSLFGGFFIYFGLATFRGQLKDVLGNSIGVIVYGVALIYSNMDFLNISSGSALIASGVLVLINRSDYLRFKNS